MHFLRIGNDQHLPNTDIVARQLIEFLQFAHAEVELFRNAVQRILGLDGIIPSQRTR